MNRRDLLATLAAAGAVVAAPAHAHSADPTDGTPMQFMPKKPKDAEPLRDELSKYPKCPYCGMSRSEFHHSRHLVQYDDDLVDGTCSLHCLAVSLSLNLDRGPKALYAADFGAGDAVKPLLAVEQATYLVGSDLKGVMSRRSKKAFASRDAAAAAKAQHGGELAGFDYALAAAYGDMAQDTMMIRKRRAERRGKQMEHGGMEHKMDHKMGHDG